MKSTLSLRRISSVFLFASLVSACGSETPTSPSLTDSPSTPSPAPSPAAPVTTDYRLSGTVTTEKGSPVANASLTLTHVGPDLVGPGPQVTTRTGSGGRYELVLTANTNRSSITGRILVAGDGEEYRSYEGVVRLEGSSEENILLRAIRTLTLGGSSMVSFDTDSSDCPAIDPEALCEWVRLRYPPTFTTAVLDVAANGGSIVPTLIADVPSMFGGGTFRVRGRGLVSLPIGNEDWPDLYVARTVDIAILIPRMQAPQQYEVTAR